MNWIENWMYRHAWFMLMVGVLFLLIESSIIFSTMVAVSFFNFLYRQSQVEEGWSFLSQSANVITGMRLLSLLFIAGFHDFLEMWIIFSIVLLVILSDGLDGYFARKNNTSSEFGAYLDAETDAFLVLLCSLLIVKYDLLSYWILSVGFLRYVYFLIIWFLKPKNVRERRFYFAKVAAVVLMCSLNSCFLLPEMVYFPACLIATLMVFFSFGIGFWDVVQAKLKE